MSLSDGDRTSAITLSRIVVLLLSSFCSIFLCITCVSTLSSIMRAIDVFRRTFTAVPASLPFRAIAPKISSIICPKGNVRVSLLPKRRRNGLSLMCFASTHSLVRYLLQLYRLRGPSHGISSFLVEIRSGLIYARFNSNNLFRAYVTARNLRDPGDYL